MSTTSKGKKTEERVKIAPIRLLKEEVIILNQFIDLHIFSYIF
jgi:hypothetical protein